MVKLRHRHDPTHDEAVENRRMDEAPRDANGHIIADARAGPERPIADAPSPTIPRTSAETTAYPPTSTTPLTPQRTVVDEPRADFSSAVTTETVVTWGPGQLVGLIAGVGMLVLGTVALTRSGLDVNSLYSPHVEVAGLHHTPLLGVVEVVFGLLVVAASAVPGTVRGLLVVLGVTALAAGIVALAATGTWLHDHFGAHRANGWLFIVEGALVVLAAMLPGARLRQVKVSGRSRRLRAKQSASGA